MARQATTGRGALPDPPTRELVLKRNSVERLKLEKAPLPVVYVKLVELSCDPPAMVSDVVSNEP